jgi:hypothetical protein
MLGVGEKDHRDMQTRESRRFGAVETVGEEEQQGIPFGPVWTQKLMILEFRNVIRFCGRPPLFRGETFLSGF